MPTQTSLRRAALVAIPLTLGLALVGCSDSDDDTDDAVVSSSPSTSSSSAASSSTSLDDAGKAALAEVGSGTVISIEQEAGGTSWEIKTAADDGSEHEVHVSADSGDVTADTAEQTDADDAAENERFVQAAKLDYAEAASKLTDVVAGTVTELGLDDHLGSVVWEGDVVDSDNVKHSVRIDASSGKTVTNTVDTDD